MKASFARTVRGLLLYSAADGSSNRYESWGLGYRMLDDRSNLVERCGAADALAKGNGTNCGYEGGEYRMLQPRVEVNSANRDYRFEFGCFADEKCNHWYAHPGVYDISADLTVEDTGAPVVQDTSGGLAGSGGVVTRDNDDVTISATDVDGLGVLGLAAYVDGKAVGRTGWSQNKPECQDQDPGDGYRYLAGQPCSTTPPPTTWELPDAPDGRHAIEVRVVDAAGNESRAVSQTVVLDRKAPSFPSAPIVSGEAAVGKRLTCSAADVDGQDVALSY